MFKNSSSRAVVYAFWFLAGVLSWSSVVLGAEVPTRDYRLNAGDKILVGVYDDPKLLPQDITINPDGKFAFPLIGELSTRGRTVEQVRAEMETKLRKYISDPSVTFVVVDAKGNMAYVVGQVNKAGAIEMNPNINVLQALSIVGGLNPYAKGDSIIIIRSSETGQNVFNFHYGQVVAGKDLQQNIQLESGDVVVVP
jgi:polysaccharide export outer membrane protein